MSLYAALAAVLENRSAFEFADEAGDLRDVPVRDFGAYSGMPVLWPMANTPEAVRRLFEALHARVIPVLLPKTTTPYKLAQLRQSHPRYGFFDGDKIEIPEGAARADRPLFMVLATSGSTGEPKLLAVTEESLTAGIRAIHAAQSLDDAASTAVWLPLAYSYALVNQLLWALLYQRKAVVVPGLLDVPGSLARMRSDGIQMLCMVAHQIQTLAARGEAETPLEEVRVLNFAGAPFPTASYGFLRNLFPAARVYNNYGCTEAMPRLAACRVEGAEHPVTLVGKPIETVRLRIGATEGAKEGANEGGEGPVGPIEFQGASSSCGVLRADGSVEALPEWIPSGDLGRIDAGMLHVMGRHDQIVKVGGERFSLIEIEQAVLGLGFSQALIWQQQMDDGEKRILAVVSGADIPATAELTRQLRLRLPPAMWPARIDWIEQWPLMPGGKTDRNALQQAARSGRLTTVFKGRAA
jgi:acyl-CoA synthetase (AMP-forming)/AMP-acid ligase II